MGNVQKILQGKLETSDIPMAVLFFIILDVVIIGYMLCNSGVFTMADFAWGGKYNLPLVVVGMICGSVMIYTFALLAMFNQTTAQCALSAFSLTFNRIFSTILYWIIIATLAYVTLVWFALLILIDVPLAIYLISIWMGAIFQKQIERVEKRESIQSTDAEDIVIPTDDTYTR